MIDDCLSAKFPCRVSKVKISFTLNGEAVEFDAAPNDRLFRMLRHNGILGVKYGDIPGKRRGPRAAGWCAVVSSLMLAAQAHGHQVVTIEGIGGEQARLAVPSRCPLQTAFVETGAISAATAPGMIIAAKALAIGEPNPAEKRCGMRWRALSVHGIRQTGGRCAAAAAVMRGEAIPPIDGKIEFPPPELLRRPRIAVETLCCHLISGPRREQVGRRTHTMPVMIVAPEVDTLQQVGRPA
jgi:aerobic-type carbon monoxide dehydrogenase small subunit (CoxS/CutS family)